MNYVQLVEPDLTVTSEAGWCLYFAEEVWKTNHLYYDATEAWNDTQFKHEDRNFPNVSVPVWYSWDVDGHVATRTPDGRVFSSPMTGYGNVWFNSVDECANTITKVTGIKCQYLGWSEDLAGVNLIKEEDMEPADYRTNEGDVVNGYQGILGRQPNADEIKIYNGKTHKEFWYALVFSDEFKARIAATGSLPKGTYLRVNKDDVKEVK
jgi:hypothetical protein